MRHSHPNTHTGQTIATQTLLSQLCPVKQNPDLHPYSSYPACHRHLYRQKKRTALHQHHQVEGGIAAAEIAEVEAKDFNEEGKIIRRGEYPNRKGDA